MLKTNKITVIIAVALILNLAVLTAIMLSPKNVNSETKNKTSCLSLVFDDNYQSHYELVAPLLASKGLTATTYIITDAVGCEGRVDWNQLLGLQNKYGWEVGSHSRTHPDLTKLNSQHLIDELKKSKDTLESHGLIVQSFAPPYGMFNITVQSYVAQFYSSLRCGYGGGLNRIDCNPYELRVNGVDQRNSTERIIKLIEESDQKGTWLILLFHDITSQDTLENMAECRFPLERFEKIVNYIAAKGIRTITISEGVSRIRENLIFNPSFEYCNENWTAGWARSNVGSITLDSSEKGRLPYPRTSISFKGSGESEKLVSSKINIRPNTIYYGEIYFNAQLLNSGALSIMIDEYDANDHFISSQWKGAVNSRFSGCITFIYKASNLNVARVAIHIYSDPHSDFEIYIDEAVFGVMINPIPK